MVKHSHPVYKELNTYIDNIKSDMIEYNTLIHNATIVDGSGKSPYKGSIAIKDDKILAVGSIKGDAKEIIEASTLTAIPGIIDSHSHADRTILFYPRSENFILQGITTFIGGQCGSSLAPIRDALPLQGVPITNYIHEVIPYKYYPPERVPVPLEDLNPLMNKYFGWIIDWHTMSEFFNKIEKVGISCNYVPLVGHGTCRSVVLGTDFKRPSTQSELEEIKALIREAMDDGCIGMSVGLDYEPGVFADRNELTECVSIMNDYGGIFCPHSRRTGWRRDFREGRPLHDKIDGLREVLDICRATGVRMNIAHLYTGWYINPPGGPEILEEANRKATLMVIDEALEKGLDVSFDVIPALSTKVEKWSYLCANFAPWLRELGSKELFAKWLKVPEYREDLKQAIYAGKSWKSMTYTPYKNPRWAENIIILDHKNLEYKNKSIAEIASDQEKDPFNTCLDLIVEDHDAKSGTIIINPEANYNAIFFQHPNSCVGLDLPILDYEHEPWGLQWNVPASLAHARGVRCWSSYIGFFDKFVKKQKALSLEQAVYKTSTYVALRHNIKKRGTLKKGNYADIVLLDFSNLKVTGTPLEPIKQPKGIEYVFVNGKTVVEKGKHTGTRPGRVLKRTD